MAAFVNLRAARDAVSSLSFDALTPPGLLGLLDGLETDRRRQPAVEHRLIQNLRERTAPGELGAKNWSEVLQQRLGISASQARRRLDEAADLGPRTTMTGEVLEPVLPHVAKRQAAGEIGAEHVRIIRKFLRKLPSAVDYQTRESCEEHSPR